MNQRHARRRGEGFQRSDQQGGDQHQLNRDYSGNCHGGKGGSDNCRRGLDQQGDADIADPVCNGAGQYREHDQRKTLGEGDNAQPRRRFGEFPGQPADGNPVHPPADGVDAVARPVQQIIAVRQRPPDATEYASP